MHRRPCSVFPDKLHRRFKMRIVHRRRLRERIDIIFRRPFIMIEKSPYDHRRRPPPNRVPNQNRIVLSDIDGVIRFLRYSWPIICIVFDLRPHIRRAVIQILRRIGNFGLNFNQIAADAVMYVIRQSRRIARSRKIDDQNIAVRTRCTGSIGVSGVSGVSLSPGPAGVSGSSGAVCSLPSEVYLRSPHCPHRRQSRVPLPPKTNLKALLKTFS